MVRSHEEPDAPNADDSIAHSKIVETAIAALSADEVGDHAHGRDDEDVHLRMSEDSEEVLVHHDITAASGVEEGSVQLSVGEQERNRTCKYWNNPEKLT